MKKIISVFIAVALCLSMAACSSSKIKTVAATNTEKQAIIDAAVTFFTSEEYITASTYFEKITGESATKPEILAAYTIKCDDVEGFAVDLILYKAKANVAWTSYMGEGAILDTIMFIKDNNNGKIYNSFTHDEIIYNFVMPCKTEEDAVLYFFHSPVLREGDTSQFFWSETEQSSQFKGNDLKEIQKALDEALSKQ